MVDGDATLLFAKRAAHAMRTLVVKTVVETFAQDTPLEGVVLAISGVLITVYSPACRDVVEYQIVAIIYRDGIGAAGPRFVFVAKANADVADYDIGRFAEAQCVILERDAVAGGGLSGDGEPFGLDFNFRFQFDSARYLEDNGAWPFGRLDPVAKRSRPRVVGVGLIIYVAANPPPRQKGGAIGGGEGQSLDAALHAPNEIP